MKHINLGTLEVARIGLGTMGMSTAYTGAGSDDAESIRTIHRALELGVTLIDTAEIYGPFTNEELVGQAIGGRRDQVVLATKFGMVSHAGEWSWHPRQLTGEHPHRSRRLPPEARRRPHRPLLPAPGRPEGAHRGHRGSARRAGRRGQDPPHRALRGRPGHHPPGPRRPPDHRAADRVLAVDPGPRGPGRCPSCGSWASVWWPTRRWVGGCSRERCARSTTWPTRDFRRTNPRFTEENFQHNLSSADEVRSIAEEVGCTPAQVSLAWLLAQGDDIAPIPGTKRVSRVEENIAADDNPAQSRPARPARQDHPSTRRPPQ